MAHAQNSVFVKKPVPVVFAFVANGLNNPKWRPAVVSIELASGLAGVPGAVYKQVVKGPGGQTVAADYRITEAVPGRKLVFQVITGPARPTGTFTLEEDRDGTNLTFALDYQAKGLKKLLAPMVQKTMDQEVTQLSQLKIVLESA